MVMEKRIIFLLLVILSVVNSENSVFKFLYHEEDGAGSSGEVAVFNVSLEGSYSSLGDWPHWCLGNMSKCDKGLVIDLWVKFTEIPEDSSDIIVFSNGGHNWYSNGVYLLQRFGNEYELSVAYDSYIWTVNFRVLPQLWTNIHVTWDMDYGLVVMVDSARHENSEPSDRDYQALTFDAFMDVVIGLNVDGTAHKEDARFEIKKFDIYNWPAPSPTANDIEEEILWLGCGTADFEPQYPVGSESAVKDCRAMCSSVAAVKNMLSCACTELDKNQDLKTNPLDCIAETDWNFYAASALGSLNSDYTINVTIEKLGYKDYVKPLEAVMINIVTNFVVQVPFVVDFGDGTVTHLDGKSVSYYWETAGTYDITVQTEVGIAKITGMIDFIVKDVDEGYAGDFVFLNAFHGNSSYYGNVDVTSIDYATGACDIKYGETNGTNVELRNMDDYVYNDYLTYTFKHFGQYNMTIMCENPYGTMTNSTLFTSQKFETSYHYHPAGDIFTTVMAGKDTFYPQVTIDHNDKNNSVSLTHNDSIQMIDPQFLRIDENYLTYSHNDIAIDKRILNVQNRVIPTKLGSEVVDGAWNLTTNITVRIPPGNNMFFNASFSAGEDQIYYIHQLLYPTDIVFEIMYPVLGYYPAMVNISNDISSSTAEIIISVEVPIKTIRLNIANITDKADPTELHIHLNEFMQGPAKVNFEIDQGNGFTKIYSTHNKMFLFEKYKHQYTYTEWGVYDICVRAYNQISSITECITVQVGQKIKYIDILMPSAGRFTVNETARSIIRCPKGSDKTYIVDFGDGETFVFSDNYLKETEHFIDTTTTPVPTTSTTTEAATTVTTVMPVNATTDASASNKTTMTTATTTVTASTTTSGEDATTTATTAGAARRKRSVNGTQTETTTSENDSDNGSASENATEGYTTTQTMMFSGNSSNRNNSMHHNSYFNGTSNETSTENNADTTTEAITTTEMPTTTTIPVTTTTMEPIPDDATSPYTSNISRVRRLRDGSIELIHRYQEIGQFVVRVKAVNHFNWAKDTLCPHIIVASPQNQTCQKPTFTVSKEFSSSTRWPLQFFRSDMVNLTAGVTLSGCGSATPTYSWRTMRLIKEDDGKLIPRPHHGGSGLCLLENNDKIFQYERSSLPFGLYKVTLTVSPSGHPLQATMHHFYMQVNPSAPHALIKGNDEHKWFLVYGTTMISFQNSIDPDFNTTDGLEYDLVCMTETELYAKKDDTRDTVIGQSELVIETITYKYTSKNPIRLYEYSTCFQGTGNLTQEIRFPKAEMDIPSEYFVSDVPSFGLRLYVTKNNLTTSADVTFEIRMSNSSNLLDQLDDLLKLKDTTSIMRVVGALSALIGPPSNSSDEEEDFEANEQVTLLKDKLIGALDSVSEGVKDIGQAGGMLGLVDGLTKDASSNSDSARVGATSAIKNSALVTEQFADEPIDKLTDVGSKVVSGVSNVLPKEDEVAKKLAEHEKNLAKAEHDAKVAKGPCVDNCPEEDEEEEGADITLDDDEEEVTELTEEDLASTAPLPYNKLLKKCDLLHSEPLDKLYKYIFFYESIFRVVLKNRSEEIMITSEILKISRNDIFCYIGILEEPADVEWYVNRYCDVEKRRRDLVRRNADRDISKSFLGAIDSVSGILLNKTQGNETVELGAPGLKVAMKKASANDTGEEATPFGGGIKMPPGVLSASGGGNDTEVGTTLIINDQNPFTFANENDTTTVGGVVTFKLSTPGTKDEIPVSNTSEPMEVFMPGKPSEVPPATLNTLLVYNGDTASTMNYHSINQTKNGTTLHLIVRPQYADSDDQFDVLIQYEGYPNDTYLLQQTTLPLPEDSFSEFNLTWEHEDTLRHTFVPDAEHTAIAGIYKIGVRVRSGQIDFQSKVTAFNYTFQNFAGGCRYWNDVNETWDSDGCEVGKLTTINTTQCFCTHLTSFGGEVVAPPNTIDFNNVWAKFKDLNENAAVFSTVVALLGLYVIGLIWARHMDKKDIIKWGASPLEDNLPTDNYHYQLSVYTGMKKNSGTKSNISFILSGEVTDTGVRRLFDGKRKIHGTSSIMNYILSVEGKLGALSYCRIWHDNSAEMKHRSWFLDQIEVTDLQTGERYYFLCNRWMACEEDDGMVDRILPVAGLEDLVAFKQLFSSSVRKKLTSDHLWLSVFSRPTRSMFTRVQRISCCMSLLFLTMITNAMWFKGPSEDEKTNQTAVSLKVGPFSFTLQQIFISLASTIIVFPPSFMLVTLFRRTKQKKNTIMQVNQQRKPKKGKWKNLGGAAAGTRSTTSMWGEEPKTSRFKKFKESIQELVKGNKKDKYGKDDEEEELDSIPQATIAGMPKSKQPKKKKKPYMFPQWCNYIAWILCFFTIITPAFFTILYSMEWGSTKANQWLTTFLLSFFQSVIVVQPIKVLCLVAFIACVLKKPDLDEEGDCSDQLNNAIAAHDEELTTKGADAIDEIAKRRRMASEALEPPDPVALEEARKNRVKEMKMEEILKEMLIYGFFVLILFFLSYQQRDLSSYNYTTNLKNMFLGKFENIRTVLDYWVWLEKVFMPTLYVAKYHNGTDLVKWWDKKCLNDFETRRMGIARMRQMRIKEDSCKIVKSFGDTINHCRDDYNWVDDDTEAFLPRWKETSEENKTILNDLDDVNPWVYQNSYKLANAPYMATLNTYKGGGYVMNFERSYRRTKRNLTRLREEDWLDLRTKAMFLEYTVYNPNANLFASIILTTEFPAVGAAVPRSEIKVFRLQSYVGGFAIVVIFFEVLYCCFTIFFFVRCIKKVKKLKCKYFNCFWDVLEFVLLCFAVSCIAMYGFKHILTAVAFNSLSKQSKAEYVNFQSLALYDEMYGYMTAIVVFLASIQFLKLLQFNKKMNMLGDTVKLAAKDLKVFSIAFILYFMAFVITAYLLFGQHMAGYNGLVQSAESTFAFTLGAFDFESMTGAQKFLGPIFFFLFIAVIYVGLMSIFLTIIADAFTTVKAATEGAENEYEMMDFVVRRFKGIIGVK